MSSGSTLRHGRIIAGTFRPHPLLASHHLQTLVPGLLRPTPRLNLRVERWELPDGDFVDLGWFGGDRGPMLILLHGLTGGFDSKYLRGLAGRMTAHGWRGVVLQFRGAGPEPNRLARTYHHGDTEDLRALVQEVTRRDGGAPIYAVGWSLGANVLLKYLGEAGDDTPVAGAVGASAPFLLGPCAEKLRTGFSRVYQLHLLQGLKRAIRRKFVNGGCPFDLGRALRARDFIEFDDAVTAPLHGFADAADYYARCACGQFLKDIRRPTLVINARDDPFMVPAVLPDEAQLSPHVTLELPDCGGHVGFVAAGRFGLPEAWLEQRIAAHLLELDRHRNATA